MKGGSVLAHMTDANAAADEEMAQHGEQKRDLFCMKGK